MSENKIHTYKKRGRVRVQRLMRRPTQNTPLCVLVVGLSFCPATARPRQMDGPATEAKYPMFDVSPLGLIRSVTSQMVLTDGTSRH